MSSQELDHEQVIELLPDHAIGSLDQADLDRVAHHLEECATCRDELLRILEVGALVSAVAPPPLAVRRSLLTKATRETASPPRVITAPADGQAQPLPVHLPAPRDRVVSIWSRRAQLALVAAALLFIVGLGVWIQHVREDQQYLAIAELVSTSTVYPLMESQISPPATGVLFVGADGTSGLLIVDDLPLIASDEEYQIWLFDQRGESSSAGLFTADASGHAQIEFTPPLAFSAYAAVAVSAEPADGSAAPTGPLVVGGWLDST